MSMDCKRELFTICDLVADWKVSREMYARQIIFFEYGPGRNPAAPVETIRRWIVDLDSLIAEYEARDA